MTSPFVPLAPRVHDHLRRIPSCYAWISKRTPTSVPQSMHYLSVFSRECIDEGSVLIEYTCTCKSQSPARYNCCRSAR